MIFVAVILAILFTEIVQAADVGTIAVKRNIFRIGSTPNYGRLYVVDWTASTNGAFSGTLAAKAGDASICGYIRHIETIPGANGDRTTSLPTSYTAYLYDAYNYDVAAGGLATRSASAAEKIVPSSPLFICEEITVSATGASNSKRGRMSILVTDSAN